MKFVDKLLSFLESGFDAVIGALFAFIQFLAKPLGYLLSFFEGIFYFILQLFEVVVLIVMIFTAIFQFMFALVAGIFRTIKGFLTISPDAGDVSFPSVTNQGFQVVIDLVQPTGLMTVVPSVCLALLWFFFALKVLALFGGSVVSTPLASAKKGDGTS